MKVTYRIITILILFFSTTESNAQFSYGGVRLSYHNVRFDAGDGFGLSTRINDMVVNVDLIHRPIRNFGIGLSARIPVIHGFKYAFEPADGSGEVLEGNGRIEDQITTFANGELGYYIKNTFSITVLGRVYFSTESEVYLDLRYTFETYNEQFTYDRGSASGLPPENINFSENTVVSGVGFTLGYTPEITDNLFVNYAFTVDFLGTDETSFSYLIAESDFNGSITNRRFTSKIDDTQTAYELSMGLMYRF